MKNVLVVLLIVIIVGAGALLVKHYQSNPVSNESTNATTTNVGTGQSGVEGKILLGPICPVMQNPPQPQCDPKPFQGDFALTNSDGSKVIKTFSSDATGQFRVDVAPGEYAIRDTSPNVYPSCGKVGVVPVEPKKYTKVTVLCDTGIR